MLQTKTFSYGSFAYQSESNGYVLDLILTEESVDAVANTSCVSYKLQLRSGANNRFEWTLKSALSVSGTQVAANTAGKYLDYHSTWVLLQGQTQVPHSADGTLDMAFSATVTPSSGGTQYTPPAMTLSGTMALTAIARASALAATSAFIGDTATIAVSRKNADYTHSIHYQFGVLSGYLADAVGTHSDAEVKLTDTTILFPLPEAFYEQLPDKPSDSCTLTCTTYAGSTVIGQAQATFTVTADPARCGPVVGGTAQDMNTATLALTGDGHILIRDRSTVQCAVEAQARQGATLQDLYVNGEKIPDTTCVITAVQSANITFRAVDSRGYTAQYTVPGLTLIPYVPLSFHAAASRTDPVSGNAKLSVQGKWYDGCFGAADNAVHILYRVDGGEWTEVAVQTSGGDVTGSAELSGLDYRSSHTIDVLVADRLDTVTKSLSVSRGIPVFDWGEADFVFHVPVTFTASDGTEFTLDFVDGQLTAT